jgi:RNA polymerase sigma factor (sigma-70 family)
MESDMQNGRDPLTELGGPGERALPPTSAALLRDCREGSPEGLQKLASLYWKPVYCLVRSSWKRSNEDAKDLAQEFFVARLLNGDLVRAFDPSKGSFRSFLRASVQNFLRQEHRDARALKRGGGARVVPIDDDGVEIEDLLSPEATGDAFDRTWQRVVLARAMRLARERVPADCGSTFEAYELAPPGTAPSYDDLAARFGVSRDTIKTRLTRFREALLEAAREILAQGALSPEEIERELAALAGR